MGQGTVLHEVTIHFLPFYKIQDEMCWIKMNIIDRIYCFKRHWSCDFVCTNCIPGSNFIGVKNLINVRGFLKLQYLSFESFMFLFNANHVSTTKTQVFTFFTSLNLFNTFLIFFILLIYTEQLMWDLFLQNFWQHVSHEAYTGKCIATEQVPVIHRSCHIFVCLVNMINLPLCMVTSGLCEMDTKF